MSARPAKTEVRGASTRSWLRLAATLNEGDERVTEGDLQAAMEADSEAMEPIPEEATNGEAPLGQSRARISG